MDVGCVMIVIGVHGPSNSGKTGLVEAVLRELSGRYRIAVVKHAPHQKELDTPGKDSHRYIQNGAEMALVSGDGVSLLSSSKASSLSESLSIIHWINDPDLVIVEGFAMADIPKIKVGSGPEEEGTVLVHKDEKKTIDFISKRLSAVQEKPRVEMEVGGKGVPLRGYPMKVVEETVRALTNTLRGGEEGDIRLLIRRKKE